MFSVSKKSKRKKRKKFYTSGEEVKSLYGFIMSSKKKSFSISGVNVFDIKIVNKELAHPLVSKTVPHKFKKLINLLTELLISDDDTGDTFREALNQIEKFRLEIKNKYRVYLEQKELEEMSKKLKLLKKTAEIKLIELNNSYSMTMENSKGK